MCSSLTLKPPLFGRLTGVLLLVGLLTGCGAGYHAGQGRELLSQGKHDAAIQRFEQALAAVKNDPGEAPRYRKELQAARVAAAHHHIKRGDKALASRDLTGTAQAYRKARAYAPADPLVVRQLSALLKLRMGIEADIARADGELKTLAARPGDPATADKWDALLRTIRSLQQWRKAYPAAADLWKRALSPAAATLIAAATQLAAMEKFDLAQVQVGKALELVPDDTAARALQGRLLKRAQADRIARDADKLLAEGKAKDALTAYEQALAADPASHAARTGRRESRRQYVVEQLATVKALVAKKKGRDALTAIRQAHAVGTDSPAEAKALAKVYAQLHRTSANRYYKTGRRHLKRRRIGAALIAWRIAAALGADQKDLPRRIAEAKKSLASASNYVLFFGPAEVAKGAHAGAARRLFTGMQRRLRAAGLDKVGMRVIDDRKARRRADGELQMNVARFRVTRGQRQVKRSKKYLDRVEFPANPQWAIAQQGQSAALANLNANTDILRPQQKELDELETSLQELQGKLVALKEKIAAEDRGWYTNTNRKSPCAKGATTCPGSYASRRWARHVDYFDKRIAKANARLKEMSPAYKAAQDKVARCQAEFDAAEVNARETPKQLRQEIWLDWPYELTMHELASEATVTVAWQDRMAGRKLADASQSVHDHLADFETAGVLVKKQRLEPPQTSRLPTDEAVLVQVQTRLLDGLLPQLTERLRGHALRYVIRAADARGDDERIDSLVHALSAGPALDEKIRVSLAQEILERTGWDWVGDKLVVERLAAP